MKFRSTFLIIIILALSFKGGANNDSLKKLTAYLNHLDEQNKAMVSVAITKNGDLLYAHQTGFRNIEKQVRPNLATKYHIGSVTKTYTAALIMKLVEREKISLSQKLSEFYPQIPNAENITIRHMLTHESGLFDIVNAMDLIMIGNRTMTSDQLLSRFVSYESKFVPGSKFEYSNTNYLLLGLIIEKQMGVSFESALKKHIIEPLKLKNTVYDNGVAMIQNSAESYQFNELWKTGSRTNMSVVAAAGAIDASPLDVAKFYRGLFTGKVVSTDSLQKMLKTQGVGFGLMWVPFFDEFGYGHGGRIDGFLANSYYLPKQDIVISIASNGMDFNMNDILIVIYKAINSLDFEIPEFKKKLPVGDYDLNDYVGVYTSDMFPLDFKIFRVADQLYGQATGQPQFPLMPSAKDEFSLPAAGIVFEFDLTKDKVTFRQNGVVVQLIKSSLPKN